MRVKADSKQADAASGTGTTSYDLNFPADTGLQGASVEVVGTGGPMRGEIIVLSTGASVAFSLVEGPFTSDPIKHHLFWYGDLGPFMAPWTLRFTVFNDTGGALAVQMNWLWTT